MILGQLGRPQLTVACGRPCVVGDC